MLTFHVMRTQPLRLEGVTQVNVRDCPLHYYPAHSSRGITKPVQHWQESMLTLVVCLRGERPACTIVKLCSQHSSRLPQLMCHLRLTRQPDEITSCVGNTPNPLSGGRRHYQAPGYRRFVMKSRCESGSRCDSLEIRSHAARRCCSSIRGVLWLRSNMPFSTSLRCSNSQPMLMNTVFAR